MSEHGLTLALLAVVLVVGCQSASGPSGAPETPPPPAARPAPPEAAPAPPPEPTAQPKASDSAPLSEPSAASMSTADLQRRLTQLGYKPGPADGVLGPRTINALKRFQRDQKLPPSGTLDAETISRLRKPNP